MSFTEILPKFSGTLQLPSWIFTIKMETTVCAETKKLQQMTWLEPKT